MAANRFFRGPTERQPRSASKPVSGAYLPGTWVEETASALTQITTAVAKRPLLLVNRDFYNQDTLTAYANGDTGIALSVQPGDQVLAAVAGATYALNDPLTIGASGRLTAATSGSVVVAWYRGTAGAITAGALVDVEIANSYVKA